MERKNISSGTIWEDKVGYSRAVKAGNQVFVSGTVSVDDDGKLIGKGDAYEQSLYIFKKIEKALVKADAALENVVRTRMYITDIRDNEKVGKAHSEIFKDIKPASTLIEVSALVGSEMLVEIEVDAII